MEWVLIVVVFAFMVVVLFLIFMLLWETNRRSSRDERIDQAIADRAAETAEKLKALSLAQLPNAIELEHPSRHNL